ncbi:pyruvate dehydrogenase complex dihydrolipoamide acetyltransferase [Rhodothermus marinus]|uniref:Acetyltransferase component of pyruvate dehydrogenase complex n=1 Tax=Rhodothermus marinus (strain ATCC 43812 / DSM 4252 / R-10) TaxID=518766 RepID=D0MIH7_RHOM4|nr:pyruvate dehydrogenase complex dihydrolipoamide acetyltransferase [Rhodothermus marinus]ACY48285.1 pyruvate dehydrogenase complex dihydrolipoamide acetyltransferase [Rhodothermus marinus DSM 4252]
MAIPIEMPKMSDTMEEGVLVAWLVEEGQRVSAGDVIAQVETDKATMDLEVYDDGVLLKKVVKEGESVPIGGLIAVLGDEGEDISEILERYSGQKEAPAQAEPAPEAAPAEAAPQAEQPARAGDGAPAPAVTAGDGAEARIKASPLARKLAREYGLDLRTIQGTGPEGRIVRRDIEAALARQRPSVEVAAPAPEAAPAPAPAPTPTPAPELPYESVPITSMRRTIARRLAQSKFTAPHFYLTVDVDVEKAIAFRQQLNELAEAQERPKISFNDLITKACALALRRHPEINASYLEQEGEIRRWKEIHIGIAVALEDGLVTPVIRNADQKGLGQIAEETRALAEKARQRKLQPQEMEGATFTTSNLGMYGIEEFTAIINPPNACILAIGAIRDVPVVKNGMIVPGKRMRLTLSCDHRIVDGATGARFLKTVQQYLEEPLNLLL